MDHLREAITAAPESGVTITPRIQLAEHLLEQGDVSGAEALLVEAQRLAPEDSKVTEGLRLLRNRKGRLRVLFSVFHGPALTMDHFEVLAGPDQTLGEIAAREFPQRGIDAGGAMFIYSGDNAAPANLDFGNREKHATLRQIGFKDGDSIHCYALGNRSSSTESFDIKLIREHLENGRPAMAQRDLRSLLDRAKSDMEAGGPGLENVLSIARQTAALFPDQPEPQDLLQAATRAIRLRDTGSASTLPTSWTHAQGSPARTAQGAVAPKPPLRHRWVFRAASGTVTPAVVHQGSVFVGTSDQCVYRFDALTGRELWKWRAGSVLEQAPAASADALYVTDRTCLTCLHLDGGHVVWRRPIEGASSPVVVGREVWAAASDGRLYRFDADTGVVAAVRQH